MHRIIVRALVVVFLLGAGSAARAQSAIGTVDLVDVWATGTRANASSRALYERDSVYAREILETVRDGALHIRFRDQTDLRLGSEARLVLDEFVYDPSAGGARVALQMTLGIGRFVTGRTGGPGFNVRTPTAVIGVRGTIFSVWVEVNGRTTVWVDEGQVEVTPLDGLPPALVLEGETVATSGGGTGVERNARRPPPDSGLRNKLQFDERKR